LSNILAQRFLNLPYLHFQEGTLSAQQLRQGRSGQRPAAFNELGGERPPVFKPFSHGREDGIARHGQE